LLIFLIEHIIEQIAIRQSSLIGYELRRNLHGQVGAMLIAVFPAGKVADHFILAVRKLSANFFQCVPLKVKLTSHQAIVVSFSHFSAVRQETSSLGFDGCPLARNGLSSDF
jgi:hypothetical protein